MRARPYKWNHNSDLIQLTNDNNNDLDVLMKVAYEAAFRNTMHKNQRSEVIRQLLDLVDQIKQNRDIEIDELESEIFEKDLRIVELEVQTTELKFRIAELEEQIPELDMEFPLDDEEEEDLPDFEFPEIDLFITRGENLTKFDSKSGEWPENGVFKLSGYSVGKTYGVVAEERIKILNSLFLKDGLSDIPDEEYRAQWGEPKTSKRLWKMAVSIKMFAQNAVRRRNQDNFHAISDWQDDLHYLKTTFYNRWEYDFPWPEVE